MAKHEPNKYDIFLSFVGQERYTFAGNLFNALRRKRIKTYFEQCLNKGDQSPSSTLKAINESKISIVVLSENYPSSSYCLDELVAIVESMDIDNKLVWPIFYKVEPSDVRHQRGAFYTAESVFKKRSEHDSEKVKQWKEALVKVANLNGWIYQTGIDYEYELIQKIVESAVQSLPRYDVFLSFSGEDTRYSFTGFLYNAFSREGFKTFMDDEGLVTGNQISQDLIRAIEKSRVSIVVFSENYGYSTWCLDELAKIMESMKTRNQKVWPIFYKVEKADVCNQTKSYGDAMTAHEKIFGKNSEKVQRWRSALSEIAKLEGEHLRENEYQYELIQRIVKKAIDIDEDNDSCEEEYTSPYANDNSEEE